MRSYGIDEFGRYKEIDGERYIIEPFPFLQTPVDLWYKFLARIDIIRWHIGYRRNK